MNDHLKEMVLDVGEENFGKAHLYDSLKPDSEEELYPRCTNFTRLSVTLKLFSLKARNGWMDTSFTELLEMLKEMLPENNSLPIRNSRRRKFYVQWVWNIKRYMHAQMIVFYTKKSLLH